MRARKICWTRTTDVTRAMPSAASVPAVGHPVAPGLGDRVEAQRAGHDGHPRYFDAQLSIGWTSKYCSADEGHRDRTGRCTGLRADGLRHRRGVRPQRPRRGGGRGHADAGRGRPGAGGEVARRRAEPRQAQRGRPRRRARPPGLHRRLVGVRRSGPRRRGDQRGPQPQGRGVPPARRRRHQRRGRARLEHLVDPDHEAGHGHPPPRAGDRHPLLQPGARCCRWSSWSPR